MSTKKLRILFFGTPDFAATSLIAMVENGFDVVGVVTAVDKPAGRGQKIHESAVKTVALSLGLPVYQPNNLKSDGFYQSMCDLHIDLGVVIAFRMLPERIWSLPRLGTINLHGSLLPQYRGAAPIHHAVINGEIKTGVTTFFLKHEIDTGDIISSDTLIIGEDETLGELHDRMMVVGANLMVHTLEMIQNNEQRSTPQVFDSTLKTAPKLNRTFCKLDLGMDLHSFHNKVRGLSPIPCAWLETAFGDMKIYRGAKHDEKILSQEKVFIHNKKLWVDLIDGTYEILELQLPGKPKMASRDFVNGLKK
jgi:methionyl-tRNA formyltransferase